MSNKYFTNIIDLITGNRARATDVEANFAQVEAGFDGVAQDIPAAQAAAVATAASNTATEIAAAQLNSALTTVTADAGKFAKSNGTSVSFQFVNKSAAAQALSANLVMTSASPKVLRLAPTGPGFSVTLQDATTMLMDVDAQTLINAGGFDIPIRDAAGNLKTVIQPGGVGHFDLIDSTTSAGVWQVSGNNLSPLYWQASNVSISGGNGHTGAGVIKLSNTLCVLISTAAGGTYGTAYDLSSNTAGTTTLLHTATSVINVAPLSATNGIVFMSTSVVAFSVAGITITPGTALTGIPALDWGLALSATQAATVGVSGNSANAQAISISGTTVTTGSNTLIASVTTGAGFGAGCKPIARSATQAIGIVYDTDAASNAKAFHASFSGTTVTANSSVAIAVTISQATAISNLVPMATDEWWALIGVTGSTFRALKLTVAGTTISQTLGSTGASTTASPVLGTFPAAPCAGKLNTTTIVGIAGEGGGVFNWYTATMSAVTLATSGQRLPPCPPIVNWSSGCARVSARLRSISPEV